MSQPLLPLLTFCDGGEGGGFGDPVQPPQVRSAFDHRKIFQTHACTHERQGWGGKEDESEVRGRGEEEGRGVKLEPPPTTPSRPNLTSSHSHPCCLRRLPPPPAHPQHFWWPTGATRSTPASVRERIWVHWRPRESMLVASGDAGRCRGPPLPLHKGAQACLRLNTACCAPVLPPAGSRA